MAGDFFVTFGMKMVTCSANPHTDGWTQPQVSPRNTWSRCLGRRCQNMLHMPKRPSPTNGQLSRIRTAK